MTALAVAMCMSLTACNEPVNGENGKSAYELAVENGYGGTLDEWLDSIKGEKGDTGAQGEKGDKGDSGDGVNDGIVTSTTSVRSDMMLKARWQINTLTVKFFDKFGNLLKTERVEYGKAATAPETPLVDRFVFSEWDADFSRVKKNMLINAVYVPTLVPSETLLPTTYFTAEVLSVRIRAAR